MNARWEPIADSRRREITRNDGLAVVAEVHRGGNIGRAETRVPRCVKRNIARAGCFMSQQVRKQDIKNGEHKDDNNNNNNNNNNKRRCNSPSADNTRQKKN
jgi:hypothetical protein